MNKHITQLSLFVNCTTDPTREIPYGYCACGCGRKTKIAVWSRARDSHIKDHPIRFIHNHDKRKSLSQALEEKIRRRGKKECWIFTGALNPDGYGCLLHRGRRLSAHRASYELHYGEIPDGMHVLHKCDNPACINPNHLWLGTHSDNMRDMANKGRSTRGKPPWNKGLQVKNHDS